MHHKHLIPIQKAYNLLRTSKITSKELCLYCHNIATFTEQKLNLNAFHHLNKKNDMLEKADKSDFDLQKGRCNSILTGIPISMKGNIAIKGYTLTAGSDILGYKSSCDTDACNYNSFVSHRLLNECNSVLIGITTMDEFGMGSLGTNTHAQTKNPLSFNLMETFWNTVYSAIDLERENVLLYLIKNPNELLELYNTSYNNIDIEQQHWSCVGGSSSGSAVSIATGSSLLSIGTDTGGSIRLPSAWTGIVGLKPTYGLLSRFGVVEYASSLDTIGIMGPTVDCCTIALQELTTRIAPGEKDECYNDSTSLPKPSSSSYTKAINKESSNNKSKPLSGIKVGIPTSFIIKEHDTKIKQTYEKTIANMQTLGATIVLLDDNKLSSKYIQYSLSSYYIIACAEASSNLNRYDGIRFGNAYNTNTTSTEASIKETRTNNLGNEVIRRILCGNAVLCSDKYHTYYESATKIRSLLSKQFDNVFKDDVHVLLTPTTLSLPPLLPTNDHDSNDEDGIDNTKVMANDVLTVPFSLAGLPAISIPITIHDNIDKQKNNDVNVCGMQIVGSKLDEYTVLKVSHILEQYSDDYHNENEV